MKSCTHDSQHFMSHSLRAISKDIGRYFKDKFLEGKALFVNDIKNLICIEFNCKVNY